MRAAAFALLLTAATARSFAADSSAPDEVTCPQPFKATFAVEWHGMGAGTSVLELTRRSENGENNGEAKAENNGAHEYTYTSKNTARGLFRLAVPDTVTQTSHLIIENDQVKPLSYVGDDGSSDTDRDVSLKFDWTAKRITGTAEDHPVDLPLEPGVQDGLSVQIALMCELSRGHSPPSFKLIDKDEVKEYQYTREGETTLDTRIGKLDTVIYRSQKRGSSRYTRLWIAPSLGYLPVRAEQAKRDKRELQLLIRAVERH